MSKRLTDSEKFKDKWYRNLTPVHKCVWEFMINECNHAGILELDLKYMSFCIGADITKDDLAIFDKKIIFIKDDIIFIPNFILFQQNVQNLNELKQNNNCHRSIIQILEKHNIINTIDTSLVAPDQGLIRGYSKSKSKSKSKSNSIPTKAEIENYCKMQGINIDIDDFYLYYSANDWYDSYGKPANWRQKVITWNLNSRGKPKNVSDDRVQQILKEKLRGNNE